VSEFDRQPAPKSPCATSRTASLDCLWRAEARSKAGQSACGVYLWTPWRCVRGPKSAPVDGQHELFGFLTTEANAVVAPIHPKAMPVILTTAEEVDLWLLADAPKALELQRPLPDDIMRIVASENGRMGHVRMQRLTEVKSRCFRCDRFGRGFLGLVAGEPMPRSEFDPMELTKLTSR
jgi:hypothetical protein